MQLIKNIIRLFSLGIFLMSVTGLVAMEASGSKVMSTGELRNAINVFQQKSFQYWGFFKKGMSIEQRAIRTNPTELALHRKNFIHVQNRVLSLYKMNGKSFQNLLDDQDEDSKHLREILTLNYEIEHALVLEQPDLIDVISSMQGDVSFSVWVCNLFEQVSSNYWHSDIEASQLQESSSAAGKEKTKKENDVCPVRLTNFTNDFKRRVNALAESIKIARTISKDPARSCVEIVRLEFARENLQRAAIRFAGFLKKYSLNISQIGEQLNANKNDEGFCALLWQIYNKHIPALAQLLPEFGGKDVSTILYELDARVIALEKTMQHQKIDASERENIDNCIDLVRIGDKACLDEQLRLNKGLASAMDGYSCPIILYAALHGSIPVVDMLARAGADVNAWDAQGRVPLLIACEGKMNAALRYARSEKLPGACVDYCENEQRTTALMIAATAGNLKVVEALRSLGANVNLRNTHGDTALTLAIRQGFLPIVVQLLENTNISAHDEKGRTPFIVAHEAAKTNQNPKKSTQYAVIKTLVAQKIPDIDFVAENGLTALMAACRSGAADVVSLLNSLGASYTLQTRKGKTAYQFAIAGLQQAQKNGAAQTVSEFQKILRELEKSGAKAFEDKLQAEKQRKLDAERVSSAGAKTEPKAQHTKNAQKTDEHNEKQGAATPAKKQPKEVKKEVARLKLQADDEKQAAEKVARAAEKAAREAEKKKAREEEVAMNKKADDFYRNRARKKAIKKLQMQSNVHVHHKKNKKLADDFRAQHDKAITRKVYSAMSYLKKQADEKQAAEKAAREAEKKKACEEVAMNKKADDFRVQHNDQRSTKEKVYSAVSHHKNHTITNVEPFRRIARRRPAYEKAAAAWQEHALHTDAALLAKQAKDIEGLSAIINPQYRDLGRIKICKNILAQLHSQIDSKVKEATCTLCDDHKYADLLAELDALELIETGQARYCQTCQKIFLPAE